MQLLTKCGVIISLAFGISVTCFESKAQISEKGIPESFLYMQKQALLIPTMSLDSVNIGKLREEDKKFGIDNRYGVVQPCEINIKEAGIRT